MKMRSSVFSLHHVLFSFTVFIIFSTENNLSTAQLMGLGFCPRVPAMPHFNITKYEGVWYEVENYRALSDAVIACLTVEYLDKRDGTFTMDAHMDEKLSGRKLNSFGLTKFRRLDGSADFMLDAVLKPFPFSFRLRIPYIIIDTDYETYSIKFVCRQIGLLNAQVLMVLSRNRTYSLETSKIVHQKIRRLGLDSSEFVISDQTSCAYNL